MNNYVGIILLSVLCLNMVQLPTIVEGLKLYWFLKSYKAYYRPRITGRVQFWAWKPLVVKDLLQSDFDLTEDASVRVKDKLYLHNSFILGWIAIIPMIVLIMLQRRIIKNLDDDKYLLNDRYLGKLTNIPSNREDPRG